MLLQRRLNERLHSEIASSGAGGVCRFLMADASTQHGREFEHIMLSNIRKADLARLYRGMCSLLDQWRLGFISSGDSDLQLGPQNFGRS